MDTDSSVKGFVTLLPRARRSPSPSPSPSPAARGVPAAPAVVVPPPPAVWVPAFALLSPAALMDPDRFVLTQLTAAVVVAVATLGIRGVAPLLFRERTSIALLSKPVPVAATEESPEGVAPTVGIEAGPSFSLVVAIVAVLLSLWALRILLLPPPLLLLLVLLMGTCTGSAGRKFPVRDCADAAAFTAGVRRKTEASRRWAAAE
mmetsp:Transcript_20935/g.35043  ORF Transcript_20935/g.35043 Transcript_20935/m.35043 type:complete len:204 (-) Transcript_20935:1469-2080(-)